MIKHLKGLEISSIYDFDNTFSINELLCKFWEKLEEVIKVSNESIDILNWIKETGLEEEVQDLFTQLVIDGTIEQIINVDKIEELKTIVNTQYAEILTKHNNDITQVNAKNNLTDITVNALKNQVNNLETTITDEIDKEISEVNTKITNLTDNISQTYQPLNSNSLNTTSKNIVGAINEIKDYVYTDNKIGDNGYYELGNGLLLQWGTGVLADVNYDSEFRINMSKEVNKILVPLVTLHDMTGRLTFSTYNTDNIGFSIKVKSVAPVVGDGGGIGAIRFNWFAICIK